MTLVIIEAPAVRSARVCSYNCKNRKPKCSQAHVRLPQPYGSVCVYIYVHILRIPIPIPILGASHRQVGPTSGHLEPQGKESERGLPATAACTVSVSVRAGSWDAASPGLAVLHGPQFKHPQHAPQNMYQLGL